MIQYKDCYRAFFECIQRDCGKMTAGKTRKWGNYTPVLTEVIIVCK